MGHGTDTSKKIIYVKIEDTKKGKKPRFAYKEGEQESDGDYLEGYITDIKPSSYVFEEEDVRTYIIMMVDGELKYKLETSYTSISRNILNALATVDIYGKIKIKLVQGKTKDDYNMVFVNVDEADAQSWKWKHDDVKQYISKPEGAKYSDFSRLDAFFESAITDLLAPFFRDAYANMVNDGTLVNGRHKDDAPIVEGPTEEESKLGTSIKADELDPNSEIPETEQPESTDQESGNIPLGDGQDDLPF